MRSDHLSKHVKIHKKKTTESTSGEEDQEQRDVTDKHTDNVVQESANASTQ